ncbi:hypothetical protein [Streptococcus suis]|uniref:Uncharacterized protein n=1 Tax=Streptococcus suis TaxID=1307 RepID=A0A0Z8JL74_STRSU|nr:hypothetical protein [Streptococcus suis]CYV55978.1 Uncharacterised protein [Streptococcus suis]
MDILNYCSLQEQSFSQLPITVLDIALLTEVNYLVFKNILSNQFSIEEGLSLEKVASAYKNDTTPKEAGQKLVSHNKKTSNSN